MEKEIRKSRFETHKHTTETTKKCRSKSNRKKKLNTITQHINAIFIQKTHHSHNQLHYTTAYIHYTGEVQIKSKSSFNLNFHSNC